MFVRWAETKAKKAELERMREADKNAHQARVDILGYDRGFEFNKAALRELQAFGHFPTA